MPLALVRATRDDYLAIHVGIRLDWLVRRSFFRSNVAIWTTLLAQSWSSSTKAFVTRLEQLWNPSSSGYLNLAVDPDVDSRSIGFLRRVTESGKLYGYLMLIPHPSRNADLVEVGILTKNDCHL